MNIKFHAIVIGKTILSCLVILLAIALILHSEQFHVVLFGLTVFVGLVYKWMYDLQTLNDHNQY